MQEAPPSAVSADTDQTFVYRFFDTDGRLLYIGITLSPRTRWRGHAEGKPWWPDVRRIEAVRFDTRAVAEAEEVRAIRAEQPRYNVIHTRPERAPRPARRMPTPDEIEEQVRAGVPQAPGQLVPLVCLSRHTLKRWIDDGRTSAGKPWRHVKHGRNRLVVAADVIAYLDESREIRTGDPKPKDVQP